jgi:hypothetical protein
VAKQTEKEVEETIESLESDIELIYEMREA